MGHRDLSAQAEGIGSFSKARCSTGLNPIVANPPLDALPVNEPDVSPVNDAPRAAALARVMHPPASPAVLDHGVNFVIVVDPAALASPDDTAEAQEAGYETTPDKPFDEEAASKVAAETLETLVDELELDEAKAVEPEPSAIAAALGAMARQPIVVETLEPEHCRYPVGDVEVIGEFSARAQITFCAKPKTDGSYCFAHHELTHAALKSSQVLRDEFIVRKLSRLAIMAALKRE